MANILVIDDEKSIRNTLKEVLEYEQYTVDIATNGLEGLALLEHKSFDMIICDIKMSVMDGLEFLAKIKEQEIDSAIVMISGHGNIDIAVDCIKKGAYDYIEKPLDLNRVLITCRNALDKSELVKETKTLRHKSSKKGPDIIGESKPITHVKMMIGKIASSDARVLITGNNGTGKELVARRLHEMSDRCDAPFVEVNCAAIPSELIESEMFGHEKGSFTSAHKMHKGKFEAADGGTLFLDEIGDMSLSAQAKVLRALQEKKITRVGSDKDINVDVRVVAATNKNLRDEIARNSFREDLYHRLGVVIINVPDLKDRADDIPMLAEHFVKEICEANRTVIKSIDPDAMCLLMEKSWPGNVRELHNVMERLLIFAGTSITVDDVKSFASDTM